MTVGHFVVFVAFAASVCEEPVVGVPPIVALLRRNDDCRVTVGLVA